MAIVGSYATVRAQAPKNEKFAAAFAYVDDLLNPDSPARARLRALPVGGSCRVELGAGVFAIEQVYATKARADGFFESHRRNLDLQVVVEGEETMELVDAARIAVKDAFNPERDLVTYQDTPDATRLTVPAGDAAVFFPADVHMPSLRRGPDATVVRKTVVKIAVD